MIIEKNFQLIVCNGPSKLDLLTSFATAHAKAPNQPFQVLFEIQSGQNTPSEIVSATGYKYRAVIDSISHEDGSGESFNISGILYDDYNGTMKIEMRHNFTGYFHTRSRTGYLEFACQFIGSGR